LIRNKLIIYFLLLIVTFSLIVGCVRKERDNKIPIADFTINHNDKIYVNELIKFTDSSIDEDGKITQWMWNFGDNTTSKEKSPTHSYIMAGTYIVSLQVEDDYDTKSNITFMNIQIYYRTPRAVFRTDPTLLNNIDTKTNINFIDSSIPGDGNITEYLWDFGDGTTSNLKNATHTYTKTGIYTVVFTITDEYGLVDSTQKITIEVK